MGRRSKEEMGYFRRRRGRAIPGGPFRWPETCTWPRGCDQPALPERAVCAEHAEQLERRGEKLQSRTATR